MLLVNRSIMPIKYRVWNLRDDPEDQIVLHGGYKEVLLKSSRRQHYFTRELEDEILACRKLDVLYLDGRYLCAFLAVHAVALQTGTVDDEKVLAADEVLRETARAVDLGGADVFPVAERAEVALFEPQSDALRVIHMPAEQLSIGCIFQTDAASAIIVPHPPVPSTFPAPSQLPNIRGKILLLLLPLNTHVLLHLLHHSVLIQRFQQLHNDAAEAYEDCQGYHCDHCEDYDAGEAERQGTCVFGLAGVEGVYIRGGGEAIVELIWTAFADAGGPVGQCEVAGRIAVHKGPVSRLTLHQK